ncbi:family 20 glycosylhydrolase [Nesterenkonia sp. HG001]|uniref:family 20 glycosylhydrolase n=1 Tax=Nesterenkonia sp. HG001 TaxID=2983207 RepID=UPI002AC533E4|nr:family 20 glycosylhydrolase [Nesterenkonia sp. HG001]MDZ5078274.1 beta-N-acetylhexosaminidase [Nesterenkonia sp. HG001]
MSLKLYPMPRRIDVQDGPAPRPQAEVVVAHDPDLPPQGYRLDYGPTIRLTYADEAGLRYAQQTLDQLRGTPMTEQQAVHIEDWPDFARRGFMLDISRDRVPARAGLRRLVEVLAQARYNHLELYTEHSFAYPGHEEVWQDASPLTGKDLRWLDDLCAARGIELVPNQNTFGHWERWLAHDSYRFRAENPEPQEFAGTLRPPSTLAPTEENARFITGLLEDLVPHFRSDRLNIGADETWELGTGESRARAEQEGLGTVFLDYVERVARPWTSRGHRVEFWSDILGSHPELMARLPEGTVPVVWLYDSPEHIATVIDRMSEKELAFSQAHGVDPEELRSFATRAQALIDADVPFWVAPGTGTWLSFVGRLDNALGNITDAALTGAEHGSEGFLLTSWGDCGHYDPLVISYAPILFGGAASWSLESNRELTHHLDGLLDRLVFMDEACVLGSALVQIGRVADALDAKTANSSPLFRAVQQPGTLEPHHVPSEDRLEAARRTLDTALEALQDARPAAPEGPVAVAETAQAIRWARFGVDLLRSGLVPGAEQNHGSSRAARRLLSRFDQLVAEQRRTWLLSSRPGGLDTSIDRFQPLRRFLVAASSERS